MLGAAIFKPTLPINAIPVTWCICNDTSAQHTAKFECENKVIELCKEVRIPGNNASHNSEIMKPPAVFDTAAVARLKGQLRSIRDSSSFGSDIDGAEETKQTICKLFSLLNAIEVIDLLGTTAAQDLMASGGVTCPLSDGISPRLSEVEKQLRACRESSRAIVFVNTRQAATLLHQHLQVSFPALNPLRVVGHGGCDGMDWTDDQEKAISALQSGESQLLVCTSVLEEGLDVTSCDLVVRFTGYTSLIQFIQSRGRARSVTGKMVIILSADERKRVSELESQERMLDDVLRPSLHNDRMPSVRAEEIAKQLSELQSPINSNTFYTPPDSLKSRRNGLIVHDNMLAVELYFQKEIDENDVSFKPDREDDVIDLMEKELFFGCTIARCERLPTDTIPKFFGSNTSSMLILLKSCVSESDEAIGMTPIEMYENMVQMWTFEYKNTAIFSTIRTSYQQHSMTVTSLIAKKVPLIRVACGWLQSLQYFIRGNDLNLEYSTCERDKNCLHIFSDNERERLSFELRAMCGFVLSVSDSSQGSVTVYLPLSSPPVASFLSIFDLTRIAVDSLAVPNLAQDLKTFGTCPVVALTFDIDCVVQELFRNLSIYETRVSTVSYGEISTEELPLSCQWQLALLLSNRTCPLSPPDLQALRDACSTYCAQFGEEMTVSTLRRLYTLTSSPFLGVYCVDYTKQFNRLMKATQTRVSSSIIIDYNVRDETDGSAQTKIYLRNHRFLDRIVVTPSRIVAQPSVRVKCSRLLRKYAKDVDIVIIRFVDEQFQPLHNQNVFSRVKQVLLEGFNLAGRQYRFLCPSPSQLRTQLAFFVANCDPDSIRSLILTGSQHTSAFKKMTILGLMCTADTPTVTVDTIPRCVDDEYSTCGHLLTDGAGKISHELSEQILRFLDRSDRASDTTSAFHFRLGGIKGVLTRLPRTIDGDDVIVRPSMKKFDHDDAVLCIVSCADYSPLLLNREVITILQSLSRRLRDHVTDIWDPSDYIMDLQELQLRNAVESITCNDLAKNKLLPILDHLLHSKKMINTIQFISEPFWRSVLHCNYLTTVRELRSKTHIAVEKGCKLMGVPDPLKVLGDNEVFLRIRPPDSSEFTVIIGRVCVYRNPCLHPGDIRVVTAINAPSLEYLCNVVVFPVVGSPIVHSCSGGDLDGDLFSVIWDPHLIPPIGFEHPPLDYDKVFEKARKSQPLSPSLILEDVFVNVLSNDVLGRVAHLHLAVSDLLSEGACDPLAIALSEAQSLAVDYPKTGLLPTIPADAVNLVQIHGYPDFMEKPKVESYMSSKLLGLLFRRCLSFPEDSSSNFNHFMDTSISVQIDARLLSQGYESKSEWAEQLYLQYEMEMNNALSMFGLHKEGELFLSRTTVHWHPYLSADRGQVASSISALMSYIVSKYQALFSSSLNTDGCEDRWQAASACYVTSYQRWRKRGRSSSERVFLSFPWVTCGDILSEMISSRSDAAAPFDLKYLLGQDCLKHFKVGVQSTLSTVSRLRGAVDRVAGTLEKYPVSVMLFGSVGMFLCEPDSDVDVYIASQDPSYMQVQGWDTMSKKAKHEHLFRVLVEPCLDFDFQELSTRIGMVLRCEVDCDDTTVNVDISMDDEGYEKMHIIHALYEQHTMTFPLFWLIFQWARASGVIKSKSTDAAGDGIMKTDSLHLLIVHLLQLKPIDHGPTSSEQVSPGHLTSQAIRSDTACVFHLGKELLQFFQRGAALSVGCELSWPMAVTHTVCLEEHVIRQFSNSCNKAYHVLSLTLCWSYLLNHTAEEDLSGTLYSRTLSRHMSYLMDSAIEFHTVRLEKLTKCSHIEISRRSAQLHIEAKGSRLSIQRLKDELLSFRKLTNVGRRKDKASKYFLRGAALFWTRGCIDVSQLSFEIYEGTTQIIHRTKDVRVPVLYSQPADTWEDAFVKAFANKFVMQLSLFPETTNGNTSHLLQSLAVKAHFGTFYTVDVSVAMKDRHTISTIDFENSIARSKLGRKVPLRQEWTMQGVQTHEVSTKKRVKLLPVSGNVEFGDNLQTDVKSRRKPAAVASSLYPSMNAGSFEHSQHALEYSLQTADALCQALQRCGYAKTPVDDSWENLYFMSFTPSTSYSYHIMLNKHLKLKKFTERSLHWVHATLAHGQSRVVPPTAQKTKEMSTRAELEHSSSHTVLRDHDVRLVVCTSEPISTDSDVFRFLFPDASEHKPPIVITNGKPKFADHVSHDTQTKINFFRGDSKVFSFQSEDGFMTAYVKMCTQFEGKQLSVESTMCELTLHANVEGLRNWLESDRDNTDFVHTWAAHFARHVLTASCAIKRLG